MIRKISFTFTSKALNAVFGFANTILLTQNIGTEGKGVVTIFMSNIALCLLLCHVLGGNSLVYLSARYDNFKLLLPCYIWETFAAFFMACLLYITGFCPSEYLFDLGLISLLFGLFKTHLFILLGNENTIGHNLLFPLPSFLQIIVSLVLFKTLHINDYESYIQAMYWVFGLSYFVSLLFIISKIKKYTWTDFGALGDLWKFGIKSHTSNVLQFFNNRLTFYVLGYFFVKSEVGIYSVAVALIEVIMLIGNSIGLILYTKVSNTESASEAISMVNPYLKISFGLTVLGLIFLAIIPQEIYAFVFGNGFEDVKLAVLYLSPGTTMMSLFFVTSSYFAGIGKFQYNNYAGLIGFAIMLIGSLLFIPKGNIITAAMVTSVSFATVAVYSFVVFKRVNN